MSPERVAFKHYWANCSPTRKRELAQASGLDIEYIGQIANGRRRPSRLAAVALVVASASTVRPHSLRPDLWSFSETLPPECAAALEVWRTLRQGMSKLTNEA